ncbi:TadE family protein [Nocardioides limicola]|uniref:TadE family protein n=1 Tax=Nocardioides limicola TaxID=2803368 RepID=UPI00193C23A1|nr:TadE family protein [Nocardioides sp. DJM-14]
MRTERGSAAAVELVVLGPVLVMIMLLVVGFGRMASAMQYVQSAAADGARAASLERNTIQSATAARAAIDASLGDRGMTCRWLDVNVDVSDYRPGGSVEVTVTCTTSLGDVALSGLPGSKAYTATAVVPIETMRGN